MKGGEEMTVGAQVAVMIATLTGFVAGALMVYWIMKCSRSHFSRASVVRGKERGVAISCFYATRGGDEVDWKKAEEYLTRCEKAYAAVGSPGYFALSMVIRPLRDRFNRGERSRELHDEIMAISL